MKDLIEKYVGKKVGVNFTGNVIVYCAVQDVKIAWGKERYLVSPVSGEGEIWVEHVELIKEE